MLLNANGTPITPTIAAVSHPIAKFIQEICTELREVAIREDTPARRMQGIGEAMSYLAVAGMLLSAPGQAEIDADVGDFCDAIDRIIDLQTDMAKISRPEIADNMRRFTEGLQQVTRCKGYIKPMHHNSPDAYRPRPRLLWAELAARAAGYVVAVALHRQPMNADVLMFLSKVTTHVAWMCGE
jgi:hypothetical protein